MAADLVVHQVSGLRHRGFGKDGEELRAAGRYRSRPRPQPRAIYEARNSTTRAAASAGYWKIEPCEASG